ncbi:MAG TPA: PD-(D/E)XK nuclease-like domain-containing protein [Cyclobacteriaceae bacterium]
MMTGIYNDISIQDYHEKFKESISATGIKLAKKSLKLWKWMQTHPNETKAHFEFGNAFELALLDKENFKSQVAILQTKYWVEKAMQEKPELKVPKSSACYKAEESKFVSMNEGKYIIPDVGPQSFESIEYMLESCYRDSTIQKLITNTEYQLSLFWTDPETGIMLKTRPDVCKRKKNVVVNLKTAIDGSPSAFSKDLAKYDYALQAAIEIRGCIATELMPWVDNYFWLVVEKEPPYNATLYEFDKSDQQYSLDELDYLLSKIKRAREEDLYPGYTDRASNEYGILTAQIPAYYKTIYS